jgi:nudix motif 8
MNNRARAVFVPAHVKRGTHAAFTAARGVRTVPQTMTSIERFDDPTLLAVAERLRALERRRVTDELSRACVLVPLVNHHGRAGVLLTKRTETVGSHKGQVSFPGGRMDATDVDEVACALRELEEEVGIAPQAARVLGLFHDTISITQLKVTPVIAFVGTLDDPRALRTSAHEIDESFVLTLDALMDPAHREIRPLGPRKAPVFTAGPHPVWGLTALILDEVLREGLGLPIPMMEEPHW